MTKTAAEKAAELATQLAGPLKTVERATKAREKAEADLKAADDAWRKSQVAAVAAGCAVNDVAAAAQVSRSRVWQLRKGPRRASSVA